MRVLRMTRMLRKDSMPPRQIRARGEAMPPISASVSSISPGRGMRKREKRMPSTPPMTRGLVAIPLAAWRISAFSPRKASKRMTDRILNSGMTKAEMAAMTPISLSG